MRRYKRAGALIAAGLMAVSGCSNTYYNSPAATKAQESTKGEAEPTQEAIVTYTADPGQQEREPITEPQTEIEPKTEPEPEPVKKPELPEGDSVPTNIPVSSAIVDRLLGDSKGNVLYSPMSLDMALAMTWAGAGEELSGKFADYYGADRKTYEEFAKYYIAGTGDTLKIANSVWFRNGVTPKPAYEEAVKDYFNAECASRVFDDAFVTEVNDWCDEKTNGMIKKLLSEPPAPETMTLLLNALYFNGTWKEQYAEHQLGDARFTDASGNEYIVPGMSSTEDVFLYNDYATGFMKFYEGDRYAFVGILPNEKGDFSLEELDIPSLLKNKKYIDVTAMIPKFRFENTSVLTPMLSVMGLDDARYGGLTEMIEDDNNYISAIIQKTVIDVNEKGTEAAAVTGVFAECSAVVERASVFLNRPFAFLIYDTETDTVLFEGKVMLPDAAKQD